MVNIRMLRELLTFFRDESKFTNSDYDTQDNPKLREGLENEKSFIPTSLQLKPTLSQKEWLNSIELPSEAAAKALANWNAALESCN